MEKIIEQKINLIDESISSIFTKQDVIKLLNELKEEYSKGDEDNEDDELWLWNKIKNNDNIKDKIKDRIEDEINNIDSQYITDYELSIDCDKQLTLDSVELKGHNIAKYIVNNF